jgi:carbonic anhydrase
MIVAIVLVVAQFRPTQDQMHAHTARALVLNCMDFRLIDDLTRYFDQAGYNNNYDDFILAGASLGFNQTKFPQWRETFLKHVELAETLHHISELIIVDHMQCGAYKYFYDQPNLPEAKEKELHVKNLNEMERTIKQLFPQLKVKKLLMNLDGSVIPI